MLPFLSTSLSLTPPNPPNALSALRYCGNFCLVRSLCLMLLKSTSFFVRSLQKSCNSEVIKLFWIIFFIMKCEKWTQSKTKLALSQTFLDSLTLTLIICQGKSSKSWLALLWPCHLLWSRRRSFSVLLCITSKVHLLQLHSSSYFIAAHRIGETHSIIFKPNECDRLAILNKKRTYFLHCNLFNRNVHLDAVLSD